jgi:hypothetical protein
MDARKEGREEMMDSHQDQREDMMKNREGGAQRYSGIYHRKNSHDS